LRFIVLNESDRGSILPHITYKELTGDTPMYATPMYKENYEIVSKSDLAVLSRGGMSYTIYPD
jgi:hypothetical protein